MKKEILTHFIFAIMFAVFVALVRGWVSLSSWPLLVGFILGTVLPDVDHLIYAFYLKPHELTSQRISFLMDRKEWMKIVDVLYVTRWERTNLIFHTAWFQVIFVVFSFLIVTSTGSLLGIGLVLAFLLHLTVDQLIDLVETDGLGTWFKNMPVEMDKSRATFYWIGGVIALLLLGFLL